MAVTPVRHDSVRLYYCHTDQEGAATAIRRVFDDLIAEGRAHLAADGFAEDEMRFARHLEGRYPGQVHNLTVPLPDGPIDDALLRTLETAFHAEHEKRFTYAMRDQPIEALHWRLAATGVRAAPSRPPPQTAARQSEPTDTRHAYMAGVNAEVETEVYRGDALHPGDRLTGRPSPSSTPRPWW